MTPTFVVQHTVLIVLSMGLILVMVVQIVHVSCRIVRRMHLLCNVLYLLGKVLAVLALHSIVLTLPTVVLIVQSTSCTSCAAHRAG